MNTLRTVSTLAGLLLAFGATSTACKKDDNKTSAKPTKKKVELKPSTKTTAKPDQKKVVAGDNKSADDHKTAGKATGETYTVVFNRPLKAGYKYTLVSSGKQVGKLTMNGRVVASQSGSTSWNYEASVVVKKVNAKGNATQEQHTIVKFETVANGQKTAPVAAGKIIVATAKGAVDTFKVDGKDVAPKLGNMLSSFIEVDDGAFTTNAMFGSTGKKKVGDSWDVNAANIVKNFNEGDFKGTKMPIKLQNVAGKVTLEGTTKQAGIDALSVSIYTKIKDAAPPMGPVVPTAGTMTVSMKGWVPADPGSVAGYGGTRSMTLHIEGNVPAGKMVMDMAMQSTVAIKAVQ